MSGCGCKGTKPTQPTQPTTQTTNEADSKAVKKTVEKYYQNVKK
jgi:hypothetical protein